MSNYFLCSFFFQDAHQASHMLHAYRVWELRQVPNTAEGASLAGGAVLPGFLVPSSSTKSEEETHKRPVLQDDTALPRRVSKNQRLSTQGGSQDAFHSEYLVERSLAWLAAGLWKSRADGTVQVIRGARPWVPATTPSSASISNMTQSSGSWWVVCKTFKGLETSSGHLWGQNYFYSHPNTSITSDMQMTPPLWQKVRKN